MKLSVIIVNYNVRYFLEQCLLSVQKAMQGIEMEVCVVDNSSVDGSVAMLAEKFPWVRLIANKENTGFSKANNQAMRLAAGEYMLLLNPDTVVQEDTFREVIRFMDQHPEAGGLGVKMVDGKGVFLPESKRGLPTPEVAFYKIFGLSRLFPHSPRFARYHLGHLDNDQTHEIEILSGAFMLMRKRALDQVGLLDEAFFMYGEDVDLSWRIIQGGWKNYYFPDTRIIHYKGESTKKGSLNYVYVFYQAMVIFAKKHFSERHALWFSFFIHLAIWLRASVAILYRFLKAILLPTLDVAFTLSSIWILKNIYSNYQNIPYDNKLVLITFSAASVVWVISSILSAAYDKPLKPIRAVKSVIIGSIIILVLYSLLPENLRFSRALILGGSAVALIVFFLNRIAINLATTGKTGLWRREFMQIAVVGYEEETQRVKTILDQIASNNRSLIKVSPGHEVPDGFVGSLPQLSEIVRVHAIDQVIFCARDVPSTDIIGAMSTMDSRDLEFKIAPPESLYIIGSNSIETSGDIFMLDVNSVSRIQNRRTKRLLDVLVSLLSILLFPVLALFIRRPLSMIANAVSVTSGKKSWVGFCTSGPNDRSVSLPAVRPGVLHPLSHIPANFRTAEHIQKLNIVYAKDYRLRNDLWILWKGFRSLGN